MAAMFLLFIPAVQAAQVRSCFMPATDCAAEVLSAIGEAGRSLEVISGHFSSVNTADALIRARKRGVSVRVLLDKDHSFGSNSIVAQLERAGIDVRIDHKAAGVYSNVIIADNRQVITGDAGLIAPQKSRYFTGDVLFVNDTQTARAYAGYFSRRLALSETVAQYCTHSAGCKFSRAAGAARKAADEAWQGTTSFWKEHVEGSHKSADKP